LISSEPAEIIMKNFTAVIERDADTGLYVGWVPGFPGAHSQGETLDELQANLREVIEMLLESHRSSSCANAHYLRQPTHASRSRGRAV
jgi:predicted RNase H-like HicB family nuclease